MPASTTAVLLRILPQRSVIYPSCRNDGCRLTEEISQGDQDVDDPRSVAGGIRYRCSRCQSTYSELTAHVRYKLSVELSQRGIIHRAVIFGSSLEPLFGATARDLNTFFDGALVSMPHSSSNSAGASDEFHPHADLETDSHNESARATLRFKSVQRILKELQNVLSSGPPPVLHLLVSSRNVACQDERAKQTKKNGNLSANEVLKAAEEADDVGGLIESLAQLRLNQMNRVPEPTKTKRWLLRKQKTKEQNQLGVGEHEIVAQRMQFAIAPKQTVADRIKAKASSSLVRERGDDCDFIDTVSIPPRFSLDGIPRNSSSLYEPDRYAGTSPEPDFGMSGVIFEALRFDAETHSESILPENDDLAQLLELLSIDESEEQKSVLKDRPSIGPLSSYVASAETLRGHQLPRSKSKDSPNSPSMSELLEGIEGIDISKFFEPLDLETEE